MEIITDTFDFQLNRETAIAIGKFDGLHLGHRSLLQEILEKKKEGLAACVFTFEPSPAVFFGLADGRELTTKTEKRKALEQMGVDILVEFPMTGESASMAPEVFIEEILVKKLKVCFLAAGADVSFGAKGAGNAEMLQKYAKTHGYQLKTIEKVKLKEVEISSTLVRSQVEAGNMTYVKELLGMPYAIGGCVQHGKALGRKLGMPTVNLVPGKDKLLPPRGVYYSKVLYKGKKYDAISNIGYKPTVSQEKTLGVESYLYDFTEEI
ncbi:MAG: riboflavin biosynthesis protein RibF, partial [Lachnospiraceae bacterium]|nr:riboflavin biosynthesis protein RibF [Lachnospiraceae bacterium]